MMVFLPANAGRLGSKRNEWNEADDSTSHQSPTQIAWANFG